jgi:hypothetical protein
MMIQDLAVSEVDFGQVLLGASKNNHFGIRSSTIIGEISLSSGRLLELRVLP